ncbi:MAG: hypothetical protein OXG44_10745 [Gammaproteobacteria bacterium]|nr:hypothetical protein [Gammaproteobacteria bacterium]
MTTDRYIPLPKKANAVSVPAANGWTLLATGPASGFTDFLVSSDNAIALTTATSAPTGNIVGSPIHMIVSGNGSGPHAVRVPAATKLWARAISGTRTAVAAPI